MKYSFAIAALAAAVQAQSLADVPKCAIPCLDKAIASKTSCEKTDLACVCKNFDDVRSAATSCVIDECGSDVAINEVLPATEKLCDNPAAGSGDSESTKADSTKADTTKVETSTKVVTSSVAVETTVADTTTVPPVVETTTSVVAPIVSTPAATATESEGESEGAGSTPSPTNVGENSAAGLKGLGAIAMAAFAILAL